MDRSSQDSGGSKSDPWKGWQGQANPNSPSGGGGPGRFKSLGPLGTTAGSWHGVPHPQAPGARYLAVADAYSALGTNESVAVQEIGGAFYISMSSAAAMRPFIRTRAEPFESTVQRMAAASGLAVVVNGNMYGDSSTTRKATGWLSRKTGLPLTTTAEGSETTPEGIVRGRGHLLGGISEPLMFHIAWSEGPLGGYTFAKGDPPTECTASLGGLGPVIIGGLRYGSENRYRAGVPAGAPSAGEPDQKHKGFLDVRSNATYKSFVGKGPTTGKVIIGIGTGEQSLRVVVQPHGVVSTTLDSIRDTLFNQGVSNAVFLDGSDSAMLFANGKFFVHQGDYKNQSNSVGVGFQLPFTFIDSPGRSMGHIA